MRRFIWLVLAVALLATCVLPGTGNSALAAPVARTHSSAVTASHAHFFDKSRFLLHAGLAFYAFHHWVINVYRAGGFNTGAPHRIGNIAKAGIATVFAVHELRLAYNIAQKSNSKTLHLLIAPLNSLLRVSSTAANNLRHGDYRPANVLSLSSATSGFGSLAASSGFAIKDIAYKIPGL